MTKSKYGMTDARSKPACSEPGGRCAGFPRMDDTKFVDVAKGLVKADSKRIKETPRKA